MGKYRYNNIKPGYSRGRKAARNKRGLLPRTMDWRWPWASGSGWFRDSERNPGYDVGPWNHTTPREKAQSHARWYKPVNRTTKRRDKRGQNKPR